MLHFPKLEPSVPALQDPEIFEKLDEKRNDLVLEDLTGAQFAVKIADYGISCRLQ